MPVIPTHVGLYLALIQLFFTLSWTVYAIYLPQLAAKAGIPASAVIVLLMTDQAIFMVADFATGVASDRVSRLLGRIGSLVGWVTLASCLAFLALPFIAPAGAAAFITVTFFWALTSSALRAPPLMLLGKYAAKPSIPYLSSLTMLGYGIAGAVSPYLAATLRNTDPRVPFLLSSLAVAFAAFGLSKVERLLAKASERKPVSRVTLPPANFSAAMFAAALIVLALGYQLHFSINSAPLFLRHAGRNELEWLMPVFWIGFNVAMFPAGKLAKRIGAYPVMGGSALIGALAVLGATFAPSLAFAVIAQCFVGAAWGAMVVSAFTLAFAIGEDGREGAMAGLLFSGLALATLARMAASAAGLPGDPTIKPILAWAPAACWLAAGTALLVAIRGGLRPRLDPAAR